MNLRSRTAASALAAALIVPTWQLLAAPALQLDGPTFLILAVGCLLQVPVLLALVALTGRPVCSLLLFTLGLVVLLVVDGLTYRYTGVAMLPVDFHGAVAIVRDLEVFRAYVAAYWFVGVGLAALLGLLAFAAVRERPVAGWGRKPALARVAIVVVAIAIYVPPTTRGSMAFRALSAAGASFNVDEVNDSAARNGLFAHLVLALPDLALRLPEHQGDPSVLQAALARVSVPTRRPPGGRRPHVVVILEESFFDPRRLDITVDPPVLQKFDALSARSRFHGQLLSPVVGGGTVEVEFSFLTGLWSNLFGQPGRWPFQTLVTDRTWTIARYLDSIGYDTIALYPVAGSLFGARAAYQDMGFHRWIDATVFDPAHDFTGSYVKDEAVARKAIEIITSATRPTFLFALTMEGHGPYGVGPQGAANRFRFSPNVSGQNLAILEDYVSRLSDLDALVDRTDRALQSLGEPVVFALFGDHLPGFFDMYKQVGFRRSGRRAERAYNPDWHRTPYFVTTYPAKGDPEERNVDTSFLASLVLDAGGLDQDPFFKRSSTYRTLCYGHLWECGAGNELSRAYAQILYDRVRRER